MTDVGPLFGPITEFKVVRNDALDLILETTSASDSTSSSVELPAGTVYVQTAEVKLTSHSGSTAVAHGVSSRSYTTSHTSNSTPGLTKETSAIHSLQWTHHDAADPCYIIEWVENLSSSFIWPHSDNLIKTGEERRELHGLDREIVMSRPVDSNSFSRSCVHIVIEGVELIIGKSRAKPDNIANPGFILYLGVSDEETRSKIRDCLSFCLGNFLIYLGDTTFDSTWSPVSFHAKSGHALVESAPDLRRWQPAPLSLRWDNEINHELLVRMMSSLYRIYSTYRLSSIFWIYWHALAAPVHMAPVHFGSAIEALQTAFFAASDTTSNNKIISDEKAWKKLCDQINGCISQAPLTEAAKKILCNKTQTLNLAPQSVIFENFFTTLGLNIGAVERAVWKNRNRAAHGGGVDADNGIKIIRENKVLLIMINRILLRLGNGSDCYYDYYSFGRPIIRLSEPVQDGLVD